MERVSLGVIMPGDRRCILKEKKWQKTLAFFAKFAWIYYVLAVAVIFFFNQLKGADIFDLLLSGGYFAFSAWAIRCCYSPKFRCPCCKHHKTMKRLSENNLIDSSVNYVSRTVHDYSDGIIYDLKGNSAYYTNHSTHKEWDQETTNVYTYNMRCSTCGCVVKVKETKTFKK